MGVRSSKNKHDTYIERASKKGKLCRIVDIREIF